MPYSRRAQIYDIEYVEDRDFEFIRSLVGQGDRRVLEVPCGSGRLSRIIVPLARELTIVDVEPEMVARTVEALTRSGYDDRVSGEISDMRSLVLQQRFDLAVIPREALQLLPPDQGASVLAAVASHLAPNGMLFVDLATFQAEPDGEPDPDYYDSSRANGVWRTDWERELEGGAKLIRQSAQYDEPSSIRFELLYEVEDAHRGVDRWESEMRLYRYGRAWIDEHVPTGLKIEALYGDYGGGDLCSTSPRLLVLYRNSIPTT